MNNQVPVPRSSAKSFLFNPVMTPTLSRRCIWLGAGAAYFYGGITLLIGIAILLSPSFAEGFFGKEVSDGGRIGGSVGMVVQAVIYFGLAFAISRGNRIAAVVALIAFIAEKLIFPPAQLTLGYFIFSLIIALLLAFGIRGANGKHQLEKNA